VSHARAAIAGALTMLLGIWIMTNDQTQWETRDVVFAIIALALIILMLVGIDIRRGRYRYIEDADITRTDEDQEAKPDEQP
jgi:thiol:disulfide interchange protein